MDSSNEDNDFPVSLEEDSFVILGRSLPSDAWQSSGDDDVQPSLVQEAKNILATELQKIEVNQSSSSSSAADTIPNFQNSHFSLEKPEAIKTNTNFDDKQMNQSVVLPDISAEIQNVFTNTNMNVTRTISIPSFSLGDFVSEELQKKVEELVDENTHLKNTLMQNNSCMKSQYEKISNWQGEVEKIFELHKAKFLQAKEYIENLKKENANLQNQIDSAKTNEIVKDKNNEVSSYEKTEKQLMSMQLTTANRKINDLLRQLHITTIEEQGKSAVEQRRAAEMEREIHNKEQLLEDSMKTIDELKLKLKDYSEIIEKLTVQLSKSPVNVIQESVDDEFPSTQIIGVSESDDFLNQLVDRMSSESTDKQLLQKSKEKCANLEKELVETKKKLADCELNFKRMEISRDEFQDLCIVSNSCKSVMMPTDTQLLQKSEEKYEYLEKELVETKKKLADCERSERKLQSLRDDLEMKSKEKCANLEKELEETKKKLVHCELNFKEMEFSRDEFLHVCVVSNSCKSVMMPTDAQLLQESEEKYEYLEKELVETKKKLADCERPERKIAQTIGHNLLMKSDGKHASIEKELKETYKKLEYRERQYSTCEAEMQSLRHNLIIKDAAHADIIKKYEEQIQYLEEKLRAQQVAHLDVDILKKQLIDLKRALTESSEDVIEMRTQLNLFKDENSELKEKLVKNDNNFDAALLAQLEVYKTDFETERCMKQQMREDNDKLCTDLQLIHRRNQQLQEEVEHYRQQLQESGVLRLTDRVTESPPNAVQEFICPICNKKFRTYRAVQTHVDEEH